LRRIRENLVPDASLIRYAREYQRYVSRYETIVTKGDLVRRLQTSDVVYHGDYHTLRQSQQSVVRIVRELIGKRDMVLCMEMFHGAHQRVLEQYMAGELSTSQFLRKVRYDKTWGYRWENWEPILDLCRRHAIPVVGINSYHDGCSDALLRRDAYSAKVIGRLVLQYPEALIYVVDGDYHISPNHLPREVDERLAVFDVEVRRTIIHQNAETLYWQLAEEGLEDAEVLHLGGESYCLMNCTPDNKLQSYLNWLEYAGEVPYTKGRLPELEAPDESTVPGMVDTLCTILGIEYPREAMERLEVHYGTDIGFIEMIENRPALRPLLPAIRRKMKRNEGFLIEYDYSGSESSYLVFLPNSSLNMAAEEAAHLLNAILRGPVSADMAPFDLFYRIAMTECLGFFGSKFINEKRKAHTLHYLRQYLGKYKQKAVPLRERRRARVARQILQHRNLERRTQRPEDFIAKFLDVYRSRSAATTMLATQLGYMLGDRLYAAVKKGRFPLKDVLVQLRAPFSTPFAAFQAYQEISMRLTGLRHKKT
jgi:hypothetical protein